jgi:hypothetical protein
MKKVILAIGIGVLFLVGCKKDVLKNCLSEKNTPKTASSQVSQIITIEEVGFFHNEVLDLTKSYWDSPTQEFSRIEFLRQATDKLSKKYPNKFESTLLQNLNVVDGHSSPLLLNIHSTPKDMVSLKNIMESNFLYLAEKKEISSNLANSFITIFSSENYNFSRTKNDLTALLNSTNDPKEIEYITVGLNVLESSNYYWSNNPTQNPSNFNSNPLWDAAGAIAGLYGGPVWSIIQGGLVSAVMAYPVRPICYEGCE